MTDPDARAERRSSALLGVVLGLLGAVACAIGGADLWSMLAAARAGHETVGVPLGASSALPAGLAMMVAAVMLIARPEPRAQRRWFGIVLATLALALLLPFAVHGLTAWILPREGYRRCDEGLTGQRFATFMWTRTATGRCGQQPGAATTMRAGTAAPISSLDDFWARFRRAALAGNADAIRALSAPAIRQRSTLDDAPPVALPAARVAAAVAQVMALPDGVDPAGRTHRAIMAASPSAARDPHRPASYHRFGDLVFERGTTGWKLTEIYLEPAT